MKVNPGIPQQGGARLTRVAANQVRVKGVGLVGNEGQQVEVDKWTRVAEKGGAAGGIYTQDIVFLHSASALSTTSFYRLPVQMTQTS